MQNLTIFGEEIIDQKSIAQIKNCFGEYALAVLTADPHYGYGHPIGGAVAYKNKVSLPTSLVGICKLWSEFVTPSFELWIYDPITVKNHASFTGKKLVLAVRNSQTDISKHKRSSSGIYNKLRNVYLIFALSTSS